MEEARRKITTQSRLVQQAADAADEGRVLRHEKLLARLALSTTLCEDGRSRRQAFKSNFDAANAHLAAHAAAAAPAQAFRAQPFVPSTRCMDLAKSARLPVAVHPTFGDALVRNPKASLPPHPMLAATSTGSLLTSSTSVHSLSPYSSPSPSRRSLSPIPLRMQQSTASRSPSPVYLSQSALSARLPYNSVLRRVPSLHDSPKDENAVWVPKPAGASQLMRSFEIMSNSEYERQLRLQEAEDARAAQLHHQPIGHGATSTTSKMKPWETAPGSMSFRTHTAPPSVLVGAARLGSESLGFGSSRGRFARGHRPCKTMECELDVHSVCLWVLFIRCGRWQPRKGRMSVCGRDVDVVS